MEEAEMRQVLPQQRNKALLRAAQLEKPKDQYAVENTRYIPANLQEPL
jgi:hypothetical protein